MQMLKNVLLGFSLLLNGVFLFCGVHFIWPSTYRVEVNHGIDLPETTRVKSCKGSWINVEGRTSSQVLIHPIQLPEFLAQLEVLHQTTDTVEGEPNHNLRCKPPKGDVFRVSYRVRGAYCGIELDTGWD